MALTPEQAAELKQAIDQANASGAQLQKTLEAGLKALLAQGTQLKENAEISQRIALSLAQGKDATEAANAAMKASLDSRILSVDLDQRAKIASEGQRDALIQIRDSLKDHSADSAERVNSLLKETSLREDLNRKTRAGQTETKGFMSENKDMMIGIAAALGTMFLGGKALKGLKGLKGTKVAGKTAKTAGKGGKGGAGIGTGVMTGLAVGAGGDILDKTTEKLKTWKQEMTAANKQINAQQTALARTTGQVMSYDVAVRRGIPGIATMSERMIGMQKNLEHLGIGSQEVGDAYKDMAAKSRTFGTAMGRLSGQNIQVVDELAEIAAATKTAGLSTENFAGAVDILGKTFRVTDITKESQSVAAEIIGIAAATGQATDVVGKDFVAAMDHLAAYSLPEAKEMFKELSVTAGETGVSVSTFLQMAGQFDNIDTAASTVGNLNAMLGGPYLNTLDLVNANEKERVAMIRESIEASGESFADMDRFKQKAIASALGVKSVAEARAMLSGEQSVIKEKTAAIDENSASYAEMFAKTGEGAAKNAVALDTQFKAARESMMLVQGAFKHIEAAGHAANRTMFQLGEEAEVYIGRHVVAMQADVADMYATALAQVRAGKPIEGILTQMFAGSLAGIKGAARMMGITDLDADLAETVDPATESPIINPKLRGGARGQIPAGGAADPVADLVQILGGAGGGGLKAHIENVIQIDGEVISRMINDNVDMHMRQAVR